MKTKEAVGLPTKLELREWTKTWIVSIFTWKNRQERRVRWRNRVRNKSIDTSHPHQKEQKRIAYKIRKNLNEKKNARK